MILVIAEQKDGKLNRASIETITAAQQLQMPITIAVAGHNVAQSPATLRRTVTSSLSITQRWGSTRPTRSCRRCSRSCRRCRRRS